VEEAEQEALGGGERERAAVAEGLEEAGERWARRSSVMVKRESARAKRGGASCGSSGVVARGGHCWGARGRGRMNTEVKNQQIHR